MSRREKPDPKTKTEVLGQRIRDLERELMVMRRSSPTTLHAIDTDDYLDPTQGELTIHWPRPTVRYYHEDKWREIRNPAVQEIKVFAENQVVKTGDMKWHFHVATDLDMHNLILAHASVSTASTSGAVTVQIRNISAAVDMLTTRITIDANEYTSYTAAAPPVINLANDLVTTAQRIAIDIDTAGTGAKGLMVELAWELA